MDSNPICNPSPTKKLICLFFDYVELLMIGQVGRWTWTPSATPLQPKKWNACFWIMFNFWWSAGLVNGFKPHPPPISSQKNEMLIFVLHSTSDDWPGWSLDSNPIHLLSQAKKNEMLIFGLRLTSDDQPGWLMNLNPICHPSPAKKMKCLFLDYFQFLVIIQVGRWTRMQSTTLLQPKNEMLIFGLHSTSDDQLGWSMDSNPICYPSPNKKMICSFLYYVQLLMIGQAGQWTQTPSATSLQPKIWNVCFWIMLNFWWSARLVEGLKPHLQPLSNQKNEMLIFVLCSTSGNQPGWSMDSNPICHPSPTKKMKCLFWYYVQLLMISWAGRWTQTPSATPLKPKKWNAHFCITFNFWWLAGLVIGLKPHPPALSSQKNEMLVFGLCSTSDDRPGWPKDSNPICHPSPTKKMKCLFWYYGQLLMISRACWWTWIPSATPLQPPKWSAHFWIMFNFWWLAGLVNGLEPHLPSLSKQKNDMLIFVLHSSSDHWLGWSMDSNPIHHLSPAKEWNSFLNYIQPDDQLGWSMAWTICHPSPAKTMKCAFLDYVQLLIVGWGG